MWLIGAGAACIVAILVVIRPGDEAPTEFRLAAGTPCIVDEKHDEGRRHVERPTYDIDPPSGGDHAPVAASTERVRSTGGTASDGELVHALEHGYVVVWYRPGLSSAEMDALTALQRRYERDLLVVQRNGLRSTVAATAWHRRIMCDQVAVEALAAFTDAYRNKGPERVRH